MVLFDPFYVGISIDTASCSCGLMSSEKYPRINAAYVIGKKYLDALSIASAVAQNCRHFLRRLCRNSFGPCKTPIPPLPPV